MRPLQELGVGLSVVFVLFVLALGAEVCYLCLRRKKTGAAARGEYYNTGKAGKGRLIRRMRPRWRSGAAGDGGCCSSEYVYEAAYVGSFGGYPTSAKRLQEDEGEVERANQGAPAVHLLFPIKEETREDMELAAGHGGGGEAESGAGKPDARRLRSRTPSDVLTVATTATTTTTTTSSSGSSSPTASVDGGTSLPPSPPPPPGLTLRPALSQLLQMTAATSPSSPSRSRPAGTLPAACYPSSPPPPHTARTSLRLLFERSPLLGPRNLSSTAIADPATSLIPPPPPPPPPPPARFPLASLFHKSNHRSTSLLPPLSLTANA